MTRITVRLIVTLFAAQLLRSVAAASDSSTNAAVEQLSVSVVLPSCDAQPRDGKWIALHEQQLAGAATQDVRIAVPGDSIAAGWVAEGMAPWKESWVPRGAYCFGIPADRTEHVLWRLKSGLLAKINPRVVMIQIGTNNLESGDIRRSPEETASGVRAIVDAVRAQKPDARIIVMGILPRQPKYDWIDAAIIETNARLCTLQREMKGLFVVDIWAHFHGNDAKPSRQNMKDDYLHLKASGYETWTQCVIDLVDGGLKEKPGR